MTLTALRWLTCLTAVMLLASPAAADDDVVVITATGEGISEESAKNDALRKALEQGAGAEISSHSNVENFELIRDTIYARSDGIITDYKILEKGPAAGGTFFCKVQAKVSKSAITSEWGAVQNMLDQIGRPGITVYILERIDDVVQDSSILESQIENRLLAAGFDVYAGEQVRRIMEKESADAELEGNISKLAAIAKNFGTQIFIEGTAQANAAGVDTLAGQQVAMYNGDAMIKMFYTDTAKLIASESIPNWRGGARGFHTLSPQAGKKALHNAGRDIIEWAYQTAMKQWATRISAGGELRLEVEGMSMVDAIKLKKQLEAIHPDKIKSVNQTFSKGVATYRIRAQMTAQEMVEYLVGEPFAAIIEVLDMQANRIQAKKVGQ